LLVIMAAPAALITARILWDNGGEWALKAARRSRLKYIGLAWHVQMEEFPVFPATDVRRLVQAVGERHRLTGWSHVQAIAAMTEIDRARDLLNKLRGISAFAVTVGIGIVVVLWPVRPRIRAVLVVAACAAVAAPFALASVRWHWCAPEKGYEYVDDYAYVQGVPRSAPADTIIAYQRPDLVPNSSDAAVLYANGYPNLMDRSTLATRLAEQQVMREERRRTADGPQHGDRPNGWPSQ